VLELEAVHVSSELTFPTDLEAAFANATNIDLKLIVSTQAPRHSWGTVYNHRPPPYPTSHVHSSASTLTLPDPMDPESSGSDVSVTGEDHYRGASPLAVPVQLPPPPPKHILESAENVQTRLRELSQVEDHNIRKQDLLLAKRRRKDDKIVRKREIQDRKYKAIMDARERRDARINARRAREDAAFRAVDDQIEEEEMVRPS
jgi:hypothetical protein